jgi:hypothetical protein
MLGFEGAANIAWPKMEGPRLFAYLPNDVRDREVMISALRQLGWPTLMHGGDAPADLPAHIKHSPKALNIAQMGQEADMFINHGGHDTVAAGLRYARIA